MMKNGRAAVLCVVLAVVAGVFPLAAADDPAGHCDVALPPGGSIQNAINGAQPGQTICLATGTYALPAQLQVTKSVSLVGPNVDNDPTGGGARVAEAVLESSLTRAMRVRADDVTIAGLRFETSGVAVWANGVDAVRDLAIRNNVFLGGVSAFADSASGPGTANRIDDLVFESNLVIETTGRAFSHYTGVRGTGFELRGNEIVDSPGIYLGFVAGALVANNTISTRSAAVFLADEIADVRLEGNELSGEAAGTGIYVWGKTDFRGPVDVAENGFSGLATGIAIHQDPGLSTDVSEWTVRHNRFHDVVGSLVHNGNGTLDARFNWWGTPAGPAGSIGVAVKFVPWCLDAGCAVLAPHEETLESATDPLPV